MLARPKLFQTSGLSERTAAWYVGVLACLALTLLPLLNSGYYSDDLVNSSLRGQLALDHRSLAQFLFDINRRWITTSGRFIPFSLFTTFSVSYIFPDLYLYKLFIFLMIILNVFLFGTLVDRLAQRKHASIFAMLLVPALFQFRLYHDPILCFSGMIQILVSLMFCSLILLDDYLARKSTWSLVGSLICFNLSLYTYEVSLVLVPLSFALIAHRRGPWTRDTWRAFVPYATFAIAAVAASGIAMYFKDATLGGYAGVSLRVTPASVVKTFLLQLIAALPASYFLGNPSRLFSRDLYTFARNIAWYDVALAAFVLVSYISLIGRMARINGTSALFWIGGMLMLAPAAMIALSAKYQQELATQGLGMGYIPVYIQYFGTALVATAAVAITMKRLSAPKLRLAVQTVGALLLSAVLLINLQSNRMVVEQANFELHYRRAGLARALSEHILDGVPDNARMVIVDEYTLNPNPQVKSHLRGWAKSGYRWKSEGFVYLYARKQIKLIDNPRDLVALSSLGDPKAIDTHELFLLEVKSYPPEKSIKEAYVVLASIQDVYVDDAGAVRFKSIPLRYNHPGRS